MIMSNIKPIIIIYLSKGKIKMVYLVNQKLYILLNQYINMFLPNQTSKKKKKYKLNPPRTKKNQSQNLNPNLNQKTKKKKKKKKKISLM